MSIERCFTCSIQIDTDENHDSFNVVNMEHYCDNCFPTEVNGVKLYRLSDAPIHVGHPAGAVKWARGALKGWQEGYLAGLKAAQVAKKKSTPKG